MSKEKPPTWEELLETWEKTGELPTEAPEGVEEFKKAWDDLFSAPTPTTATPTPTPPSKELPTKEELEALYAEWGEAAENLGKAVNWLSVAPDAIDIWQNFADIIKDFKLPSLPKNLIEKDEDTPKWRLDVYGKEP